MKPNVIIQPQIVGWHKGKIMKVLKLTSVRAMADNKGIITIPEYKTFWPSELVGGAEKIAFISAKFLDTCKEVTQATASTLQLLYGND